MMSQMLSTDLLWTCVTRALIQISPRDVAQSLEARMFFFALQVLLAGKWAKHKFGLHSKNKTKKHDKDVQPMSGLSLCNPDRFALFCFSAQVFNQKSRERASSSSRLSRFFLSFLRQKTLVALLQLLQLLGWAQCLRRTSIKCAALVSCQGLLSFKLLIAFAGVCESFVEQGQAQH